MRDIICRVIATLLVIPLVGLSLSPSVTQRKFTQNSFSNFELLHALDWKVKTKIDVVIS